MAGGAPFALLSAHPGPLTSALASASALAPQLQACLPLGTASWSSTLGTHGRGSWVVGAQGGAHFLLQYTQTCSGTEAGAPQTASSTGLSAPCLEHRDAFLGRGTGRVGTGHQGAPGPGRGRLIFLQPCLGRGPRRGSTRGGRILPQPPLPFLGLLLAPEPSWAWQLPWGSPSHLLVFPLSPHCMPAFNTPQPVTSTPARAHTCPSHAPLAVLWPLNPPWPLRHNPPWAAWENHQQPASALLPLGVHLFQVPTQPLPLHLPHQTFSTAHRPRWYPCGPRGPRSLCPHVDGFPQRHPEPGQQGEAPEQALLVLQGVTEP